MRKLTALLLAFLLLCGSAAAAEPETETIEEIVADFMAENGLSEKNFSLSYYNTVTGEAYAFNDTKFAIAASTYKLPLNMYFYEMQQEGLITGDTMIPGTGKTLDTCHQLSIVNSDNDVSELMMYYWGDHTTYKNNMRKYFTMTDDEIDPLYYQGNFYCVHMMMDALRYLYDHSADFEELLDYMKQAAPKSYFKLGVQDYEVAHKYGEVQWFMNDTAIIYTPQPFLLAVYTQSVCSQQVLGDIARLLTDYTVVQAAVPEEPELPEEPAEEPEIELPVVMVPKEEPDVQEKPLEEPAEPEQSAVSETPEEPKVQELPVKESFPWWAAGVPAVVLLLVAVLFRKRKKV